MSIEGKRKRKASQKALQSGDIGLEETQLDQNRSIVVRCSQTGEELVVKVKDVSKEDMGPVTSLTKGMSLHCEIKDKVYPVQFLHFKDKDPTPANKKPKNGVEKVHPLPVIDSDSDGDNEKERSAETVEGTSLQVSHSTKENTLIKAIGCISLPPSVGHKEQASSAIEKLLPIAEKILNKLEEVCRFQDVICKHLEYLVQQSATPAVVPQLVPQQSATPAIAASPLLTVASTPSTTQESKTSEAHETTHIVNGVDVMLVPAKSAYVFGLMLLDLFFTKEELSKSLLFATTKSERVALDQTKVAKVIQLIKNRYKGTDWDMKVFVQKANQKCRDTKA